MKRISTLLFILSVFTANSQCPSDSLNALSFPYSFGSSCTASVQATAADKTKAYFLRALCIKDGLPYSLSVCPSNSDSVLAYNFPYVPGSGCSSIQQCSMGDRAEVYFLRQLLGVSGGSFTLTTTGTSGAATFSNNILNIPNYSSGSLDTSYTGAKIPTYSKLNLYNVESYGAVPNVVSDTATNRTAIQAAINAAWKAGGGTVYFPCDSGQYWLPCASFTSCGGSTHNINAIFVIPVDTAASVKTISFLGAGMSSGQWNQSYKRGTWLKVYKQRYYTDALHCILAASYNSHDPSHYGFTFTNPKIDNLGFATNFNQGINGCDFYCANNAQLDNCAFSQDTAVYTTTERDGLQTIYANTAVANQCYGFIMPGANNNLRNTANNLYCGNAYSGMYISEASNVSNFLQEVGEYGITVQGAANSFRITNVITGAVSYTVYFASKTKLYTSAGGNCYGLIDGITHGSNISIVDSSNIAYGTAQMQKPSGSVTVYPSLLLHMSVIDMSTYSLPYIGLSSTYNSQLCYFAAGSSAQISHDKGFKHSTTTGIFDSTSLNGGHLYQLDNQNTSTSAYQGFQFTNSNDNAGIYQYGHGFTTTGLKGHAGPDAISIVNGGAASSTVGTSIVNTAALPFKIFINNTVEGMWDNSGRLLLGGQVLSQGTGAAVQDSLDFALTSAGAGIKIATGTNATSGQAILNGSGTITVSTNKALTASRIFLTYTGGGTVGTVPSVSVSSISNASSFTIVSSNSSDAGTVNWFIINAP